MAAAIFLDRDGTLIAERHYLADPAGVQLLSGAAAAVRWMRDAGFKTLLITNQSGIARGYFDSDQLNRVHQRVEELLAAEGAQLDGIYVCPHRPEDNCSCRKPSPGLITRASEDFDVASHKSFMIGDKPCDIEAGQRVGATTILVRSGYGAQYEGDPRCKPDMVCDDLLAATAYIGRESGTVAKRGWVQ